MGISIHYRGSLDDPGRLDELEDWAIAKSLELATDIELYRFWDADSPDRCVRGIIFEICSNVERLTLLFSPELELISPTSIDESLRNDPEVLQQCSIKTQNDSHEPHITVVNILSELKERFIPNLEVNDEAEFWQSRDHKLLKQKLRFLNEITKRFKSGLEKYKLSNEAAEDPNIIGSRIARIAKQIESEMNSELSDPLNDFEDDWDNQTPGGRINRISIESIQIGEIENDSDLNDGSTENEDSDEDKYGSVEHTQPTPEERQREAMFRHNPRTQKAVRELIEKGLKQGMSFDAALSSAMRNVGLPEPDLVLPNMALSQDLFDKIQDQINSISAHIGNETIDKQRLETGYRQVEFGLMSDPSSPNFDRAEVIQSLKGLAWIKGFLIAQKDSLSLMSSEDTLDTLLSDIKNLYRQLYQRLINAS